MDGATVVAVDDRDVLQGAAAVVLALRFSALKGVIEEVKDSLVEKVVVVPSNPLSTDTAGNVTRLLPAKQATGEVVAGWLPAGAGLAMAFGTMSATLFESSRNRSPEPTVLFYTTDSDRAGEEVQWMIRTAGFEAVRIGGVDQSSRLEVGGDLHDLVIGLSGRAVTDRKHLITASPGRGKSNPGSDRLHSLSWGPATTTSSQGRVDASRGTSGGRPRIHAVRGVISSEGASQRGRGATPGREAW